MTKPRSDSRLKTLPEERQGQVIELLRAKSYADTRKELAADGIETSETALKEFWSWWHLRQQFSRAERFSQEMVDLLKAEQPGLGEDDLYRYGQRVFQAKALEIEAADPEAASMIWYRIQRLGLKRRDQELLERRIKLLEQEAAKAAAAERTLKSVEMNEEQQRQKLFEIFGIKPAKGEKK